MDELPYLVTFAQVVHAGSFAGGAQRLGIAPSVASKHVAKLERRLGARLLQRSTRKLSLTEAGAAYYAHCARIVEELEQSREAVARLQAEPGGKLRVSALHSFVGAIVAPLLPEFLRRYPRVDLEIVTSDRPIDLAEEGFDLALRITGAPSPQLVARPLAPLRFVVCATPAYFRLHGTPQTPDELAAHATLGYPHHLTDGVWRLVRDGAQIEVPIRPRFAVNNIDALRTLALAGCGLALLPTYAIGDDLRSGRLAIALGGHTAFNQPTLYAVYLPNRYGSPKLRAFVGFLAEKIGDPPFWERGLPQG
ncbi:LysR family transcriptional regulator [Fontimonas sp. SYSU GA230001]|uniref:LysR family transcriptional regulator n=1 Tax=Fontimonas sp. SYSU GA230001 TaxID=3142450 RepID=UPI0032B46AC3